MRAHHEIHVRRSEVSPESVMRTERYELLIVEDDEDLRFLIRTYLRTDRRLAVVHEVSTAEEALESARTMRPHLIILDHVLEGELMGIDAAPMLRDAVPETKIVLFTASAHPDQARGVAAIDAFLRKTEINRLLRTIQTLLGLEAS